MADAAVSINLFPKALVTGDGAALTADVDPRGGFQPVQVLESTLGDSYKVSDYVAADGDVMRFNLAPPPVDPSPIWFFTRLE